MLSKIVKASSKESDSNIRRFVSDSLVDQHLKSHKYAKSLNSRDNFFVAYILVISKGSLILIDQLLTSFGNPKPVRSVSNCSAFNV